MSALLPPPPPHPPPPPAAPAPPPHPANTATRPGSVEETSSTAYILDDVKQELCGEFKARTPP